MDNKKALTLFKDWEETLIWSYLDGYSGTMISDEEGQSAIISNGDFSFCAGFPNEELLKALDIKGYRLIAPFNEEWQLLIEKVFADKAKKLLRYAIKKEDNSIFDKAKLNSYIANLDSCYEIKLIDKALYQQALSQSWSYDLVSQFKSYEEYHNLALGVAILHEGQLVSGASTYAVYNKGLEIEIDTKREYRGKGLATVAGAKFILESLALNKTPSWDAHDLRSVHLAEKLGYHLSHAYVVYEVEG